MNQKSGGDLLREACRRGTLNRALEKYIKSCREADTAEPLDESGKPKSRSRKPSGRFPNLAGFCRAQKIGLEELTALGEEFPSEIERLYVALEDEALNSGLPPPILSAYLKKRLGYEREDVKTFGAPEPPLIRFEHDVYADGE